MKAQRNSWHRGLVGSAGFALGLCLLVSGAWAEEAAVGVGGEAADFAETAELTAPPELMEEAPAAPLSGAIADAVGADEADILGSGLPEGPVADGYRSELERGWFTGGVRPERRASVARVRILELGAADVAGPAHALIAPAAAEGDVGRARLAVEISPNLPLAHVSLASAQWDEGERGAAIQSFANAFLAIPRNLEASLWLATSALVMFVAVVLFASLAFIALTGISAFPRAAHDVGDLFSKDMPGFARAALLGALVAVPLALGEGLIGLALALFAVGVAYGTGSHRLALGLAAMMVVVALFPLGELTGRSLEMLSADPVAKSVHAIVKGVETDGDVEALREVQDRDVLAAHGLALHARRIGRMDEAYRRYQALAKLVPHDPVVATNLANLEFQRGAIDEAVRLYEGASARLDSPVLWFNLSQAYARTFRMEEFETALRRAQALGPEVVADLSDQQDPGLIADLPLPLMRVGTRMFDASNGVAFAAWIRGPLAPGLIARDWKTASLCFGLVFLLGAVFAGRFEQAGTCGRCGTRICARCDGTVWNSLTCENCHRLFNHPESTDAQLRATRLAELRSREARVERIVRVASLLLPGVGGMLARRPDLAFLALALFSWTVVAFVWRAGVVPDPLVVGAAGSVLFTTTAILSALTYAVLVMTALSIRRNL